MPEHFDTPAAEEAARLTVHRTTLVDAIQAGRCAGEERDGRWYTSTTSAAKWYAEHYRHKSALYSQTAGKVWSASDIVKLREMLASGANLDAIAAALKRSPGSVKVKISKLRGADAAALPAASEVKALHNKRALVAEAKAVLAEDAAALPSDPYQDRRQQEREGRLRLHVHPSVKAVLGLAARKDGLTLAVYLTRAGLAAAADPDILERGRKEAEKIGR